MKAKDCFNKLKLSKLVIKKMKKDKINISKEHIISVVVILFEEMISTLKADQVIEIIGLGKLQMKQMKPRSYFDYQSQSLKFSEGRKVLRFKFAAALRQLLTNALDLDKLIKDNYS